MAIITIMFAKFKFLNHIYCILRNLLNEIYIRYDYVQLYCQYHVSIETYVRYYMTLLYKC